MTDTTYTIEYVTEDGTTIARHNHVTKDKLDSFLSRTTLDELELNTHTKVDNIIIKIRDN